MNRKILTKAHNEKVKILDEISTIACYNRPPIHHDHNTRIRKAGKEPVIQNWRRRVKLPEVK